MKRFFIFTLLCVVFSSSVVLGADLTWTGSTTEKADWNTASNWNPTQVPTSTDALTLSSTGGKYTGSITLADGGSISLTEVDSTSANYVNLFYGDFTMTSGAVNLNAKRALVAMAGTNVTWNITGGTFNYEHSVGSKNGSFRFGVCWPSMTGETPTSTGTQTLNISGADTQFNADRFILGYNGGGLNYKQTVNMNVSGGATVTTGSSAGNEWSYICRGKNMDATVTISDNSTWTGNGQFIVGCDVGGKGTLILKDSAKFTLNSEDFHIGLSNGTGSVTLQDSSKLEVKSGNLHVGKDSTTATSTLTVGGTSTLSVSGTATIYNKAAVTLSGGTTTIGTVTLKNGGVMNINGTAKFSHTTFYQGETGTLNIDLSSGATIDKLPRINGLTNFNGGTYNASGAIHVRNTTTDHIATLTVNDGTLTTSDQIFVSFDLENLDGKLVQNGGNVTGKYIQISNKTSNKGDIVLNGGTMTTTQGMRIGRNGEGTLTITGGTLKVGTAGNEEKALLLGYEGTESKGTLVMTGGTIDTTTQADSVIAVGQQGVGKAVISQAEGKTTLIKTGTLKIGNQTTGSGTWEQSGGTLQCVNNYVGVSGTGDFTQTGGTVTVSNTTQVGNTANGTMTLEDATYSGKNLYIGSKTNNTSGTGTVTAEDSKITMSYDIYVGAIGSGELTLKNCTTSSQYFCMGWNANASSSIVTMEGGTLKVNQNLRIGLNAPGTLNIVGDAAITAANASFEQSSNLNFLMQDGNFGTLKINNVLGEGLKGTVTADFGEGIQFTSKDSWTLVNQTGAMQLMDSDYFTVSQSGSNTIANLRTDRLPSDAASRGIAPIESSQTEMEFYTGLGDDESQLNEFVDWLNRTNGKLNASVVDESLGSVSITVPEGVTSMLWDFTNSGTDAVLQRSLNPSVPEPSTWALLLIGLLALKWRKKP